MQPLGNIIRAAYIEHQNWKKKYVQVYLMKYRITPHPATKIQV